MPILTVSDALAAVERVAEATNAVRPPVTTAQMVEWLRELEVLIREHSGRGN
jgi:hypothetical protein